MPSSPNTWLDDFVVNTNPNGLQLDPVVTQLTSGHILVVWTDSDNSSVAGAAAGYDVIGRIFDSLGNPVTDEIRLNSRNVGADEFNPSVTALANGGFVIAYDESSSGSYDDLNIETYSFNATAATVTRTADAYLYNDPTPASDANPVNPVIASTSSTSAMAAYQKQNADGSEAIIIRTYNPTTGAVGAEINIFGGNTGAGEDMSGPDITALSNGNYAITFVNQNPDPTVDDLYVYIYNQAGAVVTSTIVRSATDILDPQVIALNNGNFVVAYNLSAENGNIGFRVYANSGTALTGGGPLAAGNGPNSQNEPAIVALADGTFVVMRDDDTTGQIIGERFQVNGQNVNIVSGFVIDDTGGLSITDISGYGLADGRFTVTWSDGTDVRMKILDTRDFVNADAVYAFPNQQVGTVGNDTFTTDDDADTVHGWTGNDIITDNGLSEDNAYFGDAGDDTFKVVTIIQGDKWDGGIGTDTLDFSLSTETDLEISLKAGTITKGANSEVATNFENVIGSNQNDTITGTSAGNVLMGLGGNDKLIGSYGADTMTGGTGDDTYYVDNSGDEIIEVAGEGTQDRVLTSKSYTLAAGVDVEKFATTSNSGTDDINLTGNEVAQSITGNAGDNKINGMGGADTMSGLAGNDTYYVDNSGDKITEAAGNGTDDRVITSVTYTLGSSAQIEKLSTINSTQTTAINLTGNDFAQTITGNAGVNKINGKGGADSMSGLGGNDVYYVDNSGDKITEAAGNGTLDVVVASTTYVLGSTTQVERMTTNSGSATTAINLTGNQFIQTIVGNAGNNILNGKGGSDTLTGGGGNDAFVFDTALSPSNVDTITDFNAPTDTIRLNNSIFDALSGTGTLSADQFHSSTSGLAHDSTDRIIYETDTGKLFYDTNGNAAGGSFHFATIDSGLALTNADFVII